jgi:CubicO group peptidase (beta-lactamase class C family)
MMNLTRRQFLHNAATGAVVMSAAVDPSAAKISRPESDVKHAEHAAMAEIAEKFRKENRAPGLSVAIARDGRMQYREAFGFTDENETTKLDVSNLFRIASVSKPITSVSIFKLIESGRLRSDDRVFGDGGLLGFEYGTRPLSANVRNISVDHLLTHTCGGWGKQDDPMFSNAFMTQHQLITWTLDNKPLRNAPGSVYEYSNFGYCLLGRVIEKVSRQPYEAYVGEKLLRPCGIADMHIAANTRIDRKPLEVTYFGQDEDPYNLNVTRMDSHGGWIATPSDLVEFTVRITGTSFAPALLKPGSVRAMTREIAAEPGRSHGWNISDKGHWWHGGDLAGTSATLVRHAAGLCWAALINTRGDSTDVKLDSFMWDMVKKVRAWKFA